MTSEEAAAEAKAAREAAEKIQVTAPQVEPSQALAPDNKNQAALSDRQRTAATEALKKYCIGGYLLTWNLEMSKISDKDSSKPADSNFIQMGKKVDKIAEPYISGAYQSSGYSEMVDYQIIKRGDNLLTLPEFAIVDKKIKERAKADARADWQKADIVAESDWVTRFVPPDASRAETACQAIYTF